MPINKTLFDAVDAELQNARKAITNAGIYLDMLKDTVNEVYKSTGIEAPLSVSAGGTVEEDTLKALRPGGFGEVLKRNI